MILIKFVPHLFGALLVAAAVTSVEQVSRASGPTPPDPLMSFRAPYDLQDYANPPTVMGFSTSCYTQMAAACPVQAMSPDGKTTLADPLSGMTKNSGIAMNTGTGYASDPNAPGSQGDPDDSDSSSGGVAAKPKLVQGVYAYVPVSKNDGSGGTSFEAKSYFCPFTKPKGTFNKESIYTFQVDGKTYIVSKDGRGNISTQSPNTDPATPAAPGESSSTTDYDKIKAASAPTVTCFESTDVRTNSPKKLLLEAERMMAPASLQSCLNDIDDGIKGMLDYEKQNGAPDYASAAKERARMFNQVKTAFVDGCSSHYPKDRFPPNSQSGTLITDQSFAVLARYKATKIDAPSSSGGTTDTSVSGGARTQ